MKTKAINQTIFFDALPKEVYDLFFNEAKYEAFSGDKVEVSKEIKGTFSVFGGYCTGYNIELIEGRKIVQAWNFEEDGWPSTHYSICTFIFEEESGKTKLVFSQTEVPEHKAEALSKGWYDFYWNPMQVFLED